MYRYTTHRELTFVYSDTEIETFCMKATETLQISEVKTEKSIRYNHLAF